MSGGRGDGEGDEGDSGEVSGSGSPVYRYGGPTGDESVSGGDEELISAVTAHVERHLGPIETVFHELVSTTVHVDIHVVAPTDERPFYTLVTTGMAERPMTVPAEVEGDWRYAELMVTLPPDWPLSQRDFGDEANYWPVRLLKFLARFPHLYETWLAYGHSLPNGDPPEPFADGVGFCGAVLLPPVTAPDGFDTVEVSPDRTVRLWSVVPLYEEEMDLKLERGVDELLDLFDAVGVSDLIDPDRPNVAISA